MFANMIDLYKQYQLTAPDSLVAALFEWISLGRYTGFRSIEWCHDNEHTYSRISDPLWDGPEAEALIMEDIVFLTASGKRVHVTTRKPLPPTEPIPKGIKYVEITIRKQKNNQNYQKLKYAISKKNKYLCAVRNALNIYTRGLRLDIKPHHPAAVYYDNKSQSIKLITKRATNNFLRRSARIVFGLKSTDPELKRWSTHSICLTAANLLHRVRFSDSYIQNRLRWRSNAFLEYLRNTFYTAEDHAYALDLDTPPPRTGWQRPLEAHEKVMSEVL
jgi:hypothetical protein